MAGAAPKLEPQEIPDKLYFRIGEVTRLTGVKQYVLRFWESEFPCLGPKKSGTGHRLFRRIGQYFHGARQKPIRPQCLGLDTKPLLTPAGNAQ